MQKFKTLVDDDMSNIMTSGIMYNVILNHLPIFVVIAPIKQSQNVISIIDSKLIRDTSNFVIKEINNNDLLEKFNHLHV